MSKKLDPALTDGLKAAGGEIGYDPDLGFDHPLMYEAYGVWRTLGGDDKLPSLADIDPLSLPRHMLPHIQLLDIEVGETTRFRWRLIGTHVTGALGRDATGQYWDELYDQEALEALRLGVDWVRDQRRPIRCSGTAGFVDRSFQKFETILMPLSDDQETVNAVWMVAIFS